MLREVADPEMVATLTASRMVTACLVIAGGWLEIPVEMAPVIDVGGRCCYDGRGQGRCGVSAEPALVPASADATRARQPTSPGCQGRILARAAWRHFTAGDGRRCLAWNITVYVGAFCGSDEESGSAPFPELR